MTESEAEARENLISVFDRAALIQDGDFFETGEFMVNGARAIATYFYETNAPDRALWRALLTRSLTEGPYAGGSLNPIASKLIEVAGRRGWSEEEAFAREQLSRLKAGQPLTPQTTSRQGGCYIATAVYGGYDCPEVRVLRRFRDDSLQSSKSGRAFVYVYYAISPFMVSRFGRSLRFLAKPILTRMVTRLRSRGYSDAPYVDKLRSKHLG